MEIWQTLLIHLYKEGRSWAQGLDRDDWRKEIAYSPMHGDPWFQVVRDEKEAQSWIRSASRAGQRKAFILAPGDYGPQALVVLAPILREQGAAVKLSSLQVGILQVHRDAKCFFGYRFEAPEPYEEHNFYHAQPIQAFHGEACSSLAVPWYPDRYPAFPLKASNAFELIAAMMLACRTFRHLTQVAASTSLGAPVKASLAAFLRQLP
jgi:hypothetical protein